MNLSEQSVKEHNLSLLHKSKIKDNHKKMVGNDQQIFPVICWQEEGQYSYYQCHNEPYDHKAKGQ